MELNIIDIREQAYNKRVIIKGGNAGYTAEVWYSQSPFCNCQIFTIGNFQDLATSFTNPEIIEIIQQIQGRIYRKNLMCIDVNIGKAKRVKEVFGEERIISSMRYTSPYTASEMIMFIIDVVNL